MMSKRPIIMLLLFSLSLSGCAQENAYHKMLGALYRNSVPRIMPDSLLHKMENNPTILLLDAREPAEFEVSRIRSASYVGYDRFTMDSLKSIDKNDTVIVYCSVGYRSERIGEKLMQEGYRHVYNLYGGIFEWVNEGYPVVDGVGKPTVRIHAYSKLWGKWLVKGEKVYK